MEAQRDRVTRRGAAKTAPVRMAMDELAWEDSTGRSRGNIEHRTSIAFVTLCIVSLGVPPRETADEVRKTRGGLRRHGWFVQPCTCVRGTDRPQICWFIAGGDLAEFEEARSPFSDREPAPEDADHPVPRRTRTQGLRRQARTAKTRARCWPICAST